MTTPADWISRLSEVTGSPGRIRHLGGDAWKVEVGDGTFVVKSGPGCRDESEGLRRLREVTGAPPVPDVVLADDDLLVTTAVDQVPRSVGHEEELGRGLAVLHSVPTSEWGGGSSWIGSCRVDPSASSDGATFYGARLCELAGRCGLEKVVDSVVTKLDDLLPAGGPALVHGDLWWGNVLFGSDGRSWLIDPSVHGGHPEEDLAMLALFGDVSDRLVGPYEEIHPLGSEWRDRIALFQLYPLLVHAVLFGAGYRTQAEAVARRYS